MIMKFSELKDHVKAKHRSMADLARFVKTRTDSNSNYTLLLGAGCSVTSGIRSATSLCNEWRDQIYRDLSGDLAGTATPEHQRDWLKKQHSQWYDPIKEYSCLFERKYDLQRQRRMFVETEVRGKIPSIGYAYLTALVDDGYFNTLFTTNFDDLINEAFYLYSTQRPIVCAHDSSINSVTVTSKRPKIIKLHGDYLFDDIKATRRETESLEQNMKDKFIEFSKDYGLIVVGYAGGDRSIIDMISMLLKNENYFKHGIYWCLRSDSEIPEDLHKLFWKDKVYFVQIDGFDELFAELFSILNSGQCVPESALSVSAKPSEILSLLLKSEKAFPETTETLKKAKKKLSKESKKISLANLFVNKNDNGDKSAPDPSMTEDELLSLIQLQRLLEAAKYDDVVNVGRDLLQKQQSAAIKKRILKLIANAYQASGQNDRALQTINEMISDHPKNPKNFLLKSTYCEVESEEEAAIDSALDLDGHFLEARLRKGRLLMRKANRAFNTERRKLEERALNEFELCKKLDPSYRNPVWSALHEYWMVTKQELTKRNEELNKIETALTTQSPRSWRLLRLKVNRSDAVKDHKSAEALLKDIDEAIQAKAPDDHLAYEELRIEQLCKFPNLKTLSDAINEYKNSEVHTRDADIASAMARAVREKIGDEILAEKILLEAISALPFDASLVNSLFNLYCDVGKVEDAEILLNKWKGRFRDNYVKKLTADLLKSKGQFSESFQIYQSLKTTAKQHEEYLVDVVYGALLLKDFHKAESYSSEFLGPINYPVEAGVHIVNFEFSQKMLRKKVNGGRLQALKNHFGDDNEIAAAVAMLQGSSAEAISIIKKLISTNKCFKYQARSWPIFLDLHTNQEFLRICEA